MIIALLEELVHHVTNVLKENIVLDLITSQQFVVTVHKDTTKETKRKLPVFHAYQVSSVTKQVKANVINVIETCLPMPPNKLHVTNARRGKHLNQEVLRVLHVLQDKQAHPVMNVLKESIVLDLIRKLHFVATAQRDTSKKTRLKDPVFPAFQVNTTMY